MANNILLIVIDQFRADCIHGALADATPLPNLSALRQEATTFENHYTVTTPCGPSRASLLTGLYAMNHRSVRNGTPLAAHHQSIGSLLRTVGYESLLFGYTDTSIDPRSIHPADPLGRHYEGLAAGFEEIVRQRLETPGPWTGYLKRLGYAAPEDYWDWYRPTLDASTATTLDPHGSPIRSPARYAAEHSDTAWLTDRTLEAWAGMNAADRLSLVTYIRPHPPLVAPAPYNTLFDPDLLPTPQAEPDLQYLVDSHPYFASCFATPHTHHLSIGFEGRLDTLPDRHVAELRAVYLGLAYEVDHHIGRLLDYLKTNDMYDQTLIVVTADHGEMLGDHRLWGKMAPFDPSLHIPLIIRDPRQPESHGLQVQAFTESVDISPTLLDWAGGAVYPAHDGRSLLPLLSGHRPDDWRTQVFAEAELGEPDERTNYQKVTGLDCRQASYAMLRNEQYKYVHFNGGQSPLLYDLQSDPHELQNLSGRSDAGPTLRQFAVRMLDHRMTFANAALSGHKITEAGIVSNSPSTR